MQWDCDKWWQRREKWHKKFAWLPRQVGPNDCRWLEYVERKGTFHRLDFFWTYQYRAISNP